MTRPISPILLISSLSHWIGAKGTVHLSHPFRGRESSKFPQKAVTKGKQRRPDAFRDKVDDATTTAVIELNPLSRRFQRRAGSMETVFVYIAHPVFPLSRNCDYFATHKKKRAKGPRGSGQRPVKESCGIAAADSGCLLTKKPRGARGVWGCAPVKKGGGLSLRRLHQTTKPGRAWFCLVETVGVEPTTPCLQGRCSSQLSYAPVWV